MKFKAYAVLKDTVNVTVEYWYNTKKGAVRKYNQLLKEQGTTYSETGWATYNSLGWEL